MAKRKIPEINASSMADISFLLLIFFLVSTSMSVDKGLSRRLPPPLQPNQKVEDMDINKRNNFVVKINSMNPDDDDFLDYVYLSMSRIKGQVGTQGIVAVKSHPWYF